MSPLDQLTGPIALYPDPLIALILPASTFPDDIASAAHYLTNNGDPTRIDFQPWDASVRGLAHYPNVLEWMAENPDWTSALGAAFANNPGDVMASIQKLRTAAQAAGTLGETPQQDVVDEDGAIAIEPADPNLIYVPSYDPAVVFVAGPYFGYAGPFLTFGVGCPVGFWLAYEFDWHRHVVWYGDWRNWHNGQGWRHPVFPGQQGYINAPDSRRWTPTHNPYPPVRTKAVIRTTSMPGAPRPPEPVHATRSPWASPQSIPRPTSPAPQVGRQVQLPSSHAEYAYPVVSEPEPGGASRAPYAPERPRPAAPPPKREPPKPQQTKKPDR